MVIGPFPWLTMVVVWWWLGYERGEKGVFFFRVVAIYVM